MGRRHVAGCHLKGEKGPGGPRQTAANCRGLGVPHLEHSERFCSVFLSKYARLFQAVLASMAGQS